jgi:hypothetical protein
VSSTYWQRWHEPYEDPGSYLSRRLAVVQQRIAERLSAAPAGPIVAISACAGEGRDLLGVLRDHPRRSDVRARLVELDPVNAEVARAAAEHLALADIEVVNADASVTDAYAGWVPADLILLCGVFGNVVDRDIEHTIRRLPTLAAPGASVVWTRHRGEPDLTPAVRRWFAEAGFDELAFDGPDDALFGVGLHRFVGDPEPFEPGVKLFEFVVGR